MNLFTSLKSRVSGQSEGGHDARQRSVLTKELTRAITDHMAEFKKVDLSKYTFERRSSDYPETASELTVYDTQDHVAFHGRKARDGLVTFWR